MDTHDGVIRPRSLVHVNRAPRPQGVHLTSLGLHQKKEEGTPQPHMGPVAQISLAQADKTGHLDDYFGTQVVKVDPLFGKNVI